MRAAVFVRYQSGDEMGHVGWAFDVLPGERINSGSVENHTGHLFSPSQGDGFWTHVSSDPVKDMAKRRYDDAKFVDVENADPVCAYRVVLWIREQAYRAAFRNCEDDVYDVLRAYGVPDLPVPALHWLPNRWFSTFEGAQVPVSAFDWNASRPESAPAAGAFDLSGLTPLCPSWRRPMSWDFQRLHLSKAGQLLRFKRKRKRLPHVPG